MSQSSGLSQWLEKDLGELEGLLRGLKPEDAEALWDEVLGAKRVFILGAGRSGLMLKAFAMRLMHIGLTAHVVGEVSTPSAGRGDLLIVASASGSTGTIVAGARLARRAGARIAALTAGAASPIGRLANVSVRFKGASTKKRGFPLEGMPLGTVFEQALLVFLDCSVASLAARLGVTEDDMRSRHANLE